MLRDCELGQGRRSEVPWCHERRWLAIGVICAGALMVMLDTTIVGIALPAIRQDLHFTDSSVAWVANAYTLTFGVSLVPGGCLGDLWGRRELFLVGVLFFTMASAACGMADVRLVLITARALQGIGGAVIIGVALSLIIAMFPDHVERAQAIGIYSFICSTGGSMGLLLGGALTSALDWHWIFLANLSMGPAVYLFARKLLPSVTGDTTGGWRVRVHAGLASLTLFRVRNFGVCNIVAGLWAASLSAWFFISTLYMQRALGYPPMRVALEFLPSNIVTAVFAVGISAKLVTRVGIRAPLCLGMLLGAMGLALLANGPLGYSEVESILVAMLLLGLGSGMAYNPLLLAAMRDVPTENSGAASGVMSTASVLGGGVGLTVVASAATAWTRHVLAMGGPARPALVAGYRCAFLLGALLAVAATAIGAGFLRITPEVPLREHRDPLRSGLRRQHSG